MNILNYNKTMSSAPNTNDSQITQDAKKPVPECVTKVVSDALATATISKKGTFTQVKFKNPIRMEFF